MDGKPCSDFSPKNRPHRAEYDLTNKLYRDKTYIEKLIESERYNFRAEWGIYNNEYGDGGLKN